MSAFKSAQKKRMDISRATNLVWRQRERLGASKWAGQCERRDRAQWGGMKLVGREKRQTPEVKTWESRRGPSHSGCQQAMPIEDATAQSTAPVAGGKVNCSSRSGTNNSRIEESSWKLSSHVTEDRARGQVSVGRSKLGSNSKQALARGDFQVSLCPFGFGLADLDRSSHISHRIEMFAVSSPPFSFPNSMPSRPSASATRTMGMKPNSTLPRHQQVTNPQGHRHGTSYL